MLLLPGCSPLEELETGDYQTENRTGARIEILSGYNSDGATRAIDGFCEADFLKIMEFQYQVLNSNDGGTVAATNLTMTASHDLSDLNDLGGDKWREAPTIGGTRLTASSNYYLSVPAIAYKSEYARYLSLSTWNSSSSSTKKLSALALPLKSSDGVYYTPEIYYGYLHPDFFDTNGEEFNPDYGIYKINVSTADYYSYPATGILRRITGKMRFEVTCPSRWESVKLECYQYPLTINMFGSHGKGYPITPVTSASSTWKKLKTKSVVDGYVEFETNLLPTELGVRFRLECTDAGGTTETYPVSFTRDLILEDVDEIYTPINSYCVAGDNQLYIYRQETDLFYVYSNVFTTIRVQLPE